MRIITNKIRSRIGFTVIYHPFEDNASKAPEIFENSFKLLDSLNEAEIIKANQLILDSNSAISVGNQFNNAEVDIICLKLATWSSDNLIFDLLSRCDVPIIFWAYPHLRAGSLCGAQQFNCVLKEIGKECKFVYNDIKQSLEDIVAYANVVSIKNRLKQLKIGQIGGRTQGMAEIICDEFSLMEIFGSRVLAIDLRDFNNLVVETPENEVKDLWEKTKSLIRNIKISEEAGMDAINSYYKLKKFIKNDQLEALTIECYPNDMGKTCLGFSLLADEGIACACEGDVHSALLMWIMMNLSGSPVHNTDTLYVNEEDNSVIGSHCGCGSIQLADSLEKVELSQVRLAEGGVCILFPSKPGTVTMANLVGRADTYRLGVILGEAVPTEMIFPGNPLKVQLPIVISEYLKIIEDYGLGHHWIVAYGDITNELRTLSRLLNINYIQF